MTMKTELGLLWLLGYSLACTTPDEGTPPVSGAHPTVTVTTVAGHYQADIRGGFTDGKGAAARFRYPGQMAIDKNDNLYILDQGSYSEEATVIRKMDAAGNVTTFADGFKTLADICIDPRDGVTLYVVDNHASLRGTNSIYKIIPNGTKTIIAGGIHLRGYKDGPIAEAKFDRPAGIAMDKNGMLYVADTYNYCIRKIDLNTGTVSTFAGHYININEWTCSLKNGKSAEAEFCTFTDLTVDLQGNVFVPDRYNHVIRKITSDGAVSSLFPALKGYEKEGSLTQATSEFPVRTSFDAVGGNLFISSSSGAHLRVVTAAGMVYNLAGSYGSTFDHGYQDGDQATAKFNGIMGLAVNKKGEVFIADNVNHCIRKVVIKGL